MKRKLLHHLRCPKCQGHLECKTGSEQDGEILQGLLICRNGCEDFPISDGVPRMLTNELKDVMRSTAERFGYKWQNYHDFKSRYEKGFLDWISPVTKEHFKGKVVLDAGCGHGHHAYLASDFGAQEVIAIDISTSGANAAYRNTSHLPNVHVVQADIYNLPFSHKSFDYIYSIGVLHHLPAPKKGFASLARFLKDIGQITAWVYGRENNGWIVHLVDPIRKNITSKIPMKVLSVFSFLLTLFLYFLVHFVYRPINGLLKPLKKTLFYSEYLNYIARWDFKEMYYCVLDHLLPPVAFYISQGEFKQWFIDSGMDIDSMRLHNKNSWSATGRYNKQELSKAETNGKSIRQLIS